MSKNFIKTVLVLSAGLLLIAGCTSTGAATTQNVPPQASGNARNLKFEIIDWQGASFGAEIPEWAQIVLSDKEQLDRIAAAPTYKDLAVRTASAQGKDIDLLKRWVQNDIAAAVTREIAQTITVKSGQGMSGNKDSDKDAQKLLQDVMGVFSSVTLNGLEKSREFWVGRRDKGTGKESYEYVVVYVINKEDLQLQIDRALGKVAAKTEKEKAMLTDIKAAIQNSVDKVQHIDFGEQ